MKKTLILMATFASLAFIGCSERVDDVLDEETVIPEEPQQPEQHEFYLALYITSGISVSASQYPTTFDTGLDAAGTSEDSFVATVEDGIIKACHVGETIIYVGDNTYNVTVTSVMNTFMMPITEFGQSKDYIASKETRKRSQGAHKGLIYDGEKDYINQVVYIFDSDVDELIQIEVRLNDKGQAQNMYASCATYLGHYYEKLMYDNDKDILVYINAYEEKDATFRVYLPNTYPTGATTTIKFLPKE